MKWHIVYVWAKCGLNEFSTVSLKYFYLSSKGGENQRASNIWFVEPSESVCEWLSFPKPH